MRPESQEKVLSQGYPASAATGMAVEPYKVLKNTYLLLALTLVVSAVGAAVSMAVGMPRLGALVLTLVGLGLIFAIHRTAESSTGIYLTFLFAAIMGAALGPMLSLYLALPSGPMYVLQALGGTALVFFGLSGYVLTSRKDFSNIGGFLFIGLIIAVVAGLANIFLAIPALSLAISSAIVFIMSGFILYDTSRIIHGGETNYVRATVGLYLNIYNLFTSLLHLIGVFGGEE